MARKIAQFVNRAKDLLAYLDSSGKWFARTMLTDEIEVTTQIKFTNGAWITYNSDWKIIEFNYPDGTKLQNGAELWFIAKAVGTIANGDCVQFVDIQGDHYRVKKVNVDEVNANPDLFMGIATVDGVDNEYVKVTWFGEVNDIDTSMYTLPDDTILYLSTAPGNGLTSTKPSAPDAVIQVAALVKVHQEQGRLLVRPQFKNVLADEVSVTDAGNYYTGENLEEILQEIGPQLGGSGIVNDPIDYYVSPTGSDSNPGTLAEPFETINHAISVIPKQFSLYAEIHLAAGTYDEVVDISSFSGPGDLSITGNTSSPASYSITGISISWCSLNSITIAGVTMIPEWPSEAFSIQQVMSLVMIDTCKTDTTSADEFIFAESALNIIVDSCFCENVTYAVRAQKNSKVLSQNWDTGSTATSTALSAETGSIISIGQGDQPLGTGGGVDYSTSFGGMIHREVNMVPQNYVSATEPTGYNFNVGDVWFIP